MKPLDPRLLRVAPAAIWFMVAGALIGVLGAAATITAAWFTAKAATSAMAGHQLDTLWPLIAGLIAAVIVRGLCAWGMDAAAARAGTLAVSQVRERLIDAIDSLGPGWVRARHSLDLTTTAGGGLTALEGYFSRYLPQLLLCAIATPMIMLAIGLADVPSLITIIATIPAIPLFMWLIGLATQRASDKRFRALTDLAVGFLDVIEGLSTLKIFGRAERQRARVRAITDEYRRSTMGVLRLSFLSGFALELLASLAVAIIAVTIGIRLVNDMMLLQTGLFVLLLAPEAFIPLREVGARYHAAADGVAAADAALAVIDDANARPGTSVASAPEAADEHAQDALEFRNVTVTHDGLIAAEGLTATAFVGEVTVLTGESGAGKTTLLDVARGVVTPDAGTVRFRGDEVTAEHVSWSGQRAELFEGTVRENLRIGDSSDASDGLLNQALHAVGLDEEITLATPLGPGGAGLSGGQAQRLTLARAIVRARRLSTPIVLADEPSSALDTDAERLVVRALRDLANRGAAVLVVSHREEIIRGADRIIELATPRREAQVRSGASEQTDEAASDHTVAPPEPVVTGAPAKAAAAATHRGELTPMRARIIDLLATLGGPGQRALTRDEQDVLNLALPTLGSLAPAIGFGVLWGVSVVALLACSGYLITAASLTTFILLLQIPIVGVRAFALGRSVFRYLERLAGHDVSFRQLGQMRVGVLERMLPLAPAGIAGARRSDVLASIVDDIDELQFLTLRIVEPLIVSSITMLLSVIGVAIVWPPAGVTLLVALILAFVVAVLANERVAGARERELAGRRAELIRRVEQFVSGLDVLRAFGGKPDAREAVDRADAQLADAVLARTLGAGVISGAVTLCAGLASAAALAVGINATATGALAAPMLTLITMVPLAVFEVFQAVPVAVTSWRSVRASASRIAESIPSGRPSEIPDETEPTPAIDLPEGPVTIELRDFTAAWPERAGTRAETGIPEQQPVGPISLIVNPGDRVLVTGPSGSGKTTLAYALVRFLEHGGEYEINGVDARSLDVRDVRRAVGLIEQRPHLFANTIEQNLLFAKPDATADELERVLERVGLDEWVRQRGGLGANVGERGALVSGGQAQRIALARALLADFPVLVLDEPTASVDADRANALIRELIDAAGSERALIIISHVPLEAGVATGRIRLEQPRPQAERDSIRSASLER